MENAGRKHPTHGVHFDFGKTTLVFLTICTKDRKPWLACVEAHEILLQAWRGSSNWRVGRYMLMPDHLHLFCTPAELGNPLEPWVKYWKNLFSRACGNPRWRWQTDHWDTRLRREESYSDKWAYVEQNPVRAGLVGDSAEWPFQGELHELRW